MTEFPTTAAGFLNPLIAALMAQILSLWLGQYLPDWRWRDLLLLALSIGVELAAALSAGALNSGADWFSAVWLGFLGASIATFGYEAVANLLGLAEQGPRRTTRLRVLLGGRGWR